MVTRVSSDLTLPSFALVVSLILHALVMTGCDDDDGPPTEAPATSLLHDTFDYPDGSVPSGWTSVPDTVVTFVVTSGVFANEWAGAAVVVYSRLEFATPAIYPMNVWRGNSARAGLSIMWRLSDPTATTGSGLAAELVVAENPTHADTLRFVRLSWMSGLGAHGRTVLADTLVELATGFDLMSVYDCGDSAWISVGSAVESAVELAVAVPDGVAASGWLALADLGLEGRIGFNEVNVTTTGGPSRCAGGAARRAPLGP